MKVKESGREKIEKSESEKQRFKDLKGKNDKFREGDSLGPCRKRSRSALALQVMDSNSINNFQHKFSTPRVCNCDFIYIHSFLLM